MFRFNEIAGAFQQANAQAALARQQEAIARQYYEDQQRFSNQDGAVNLVLRDGVYVLPEQVGYDGKR